MIRPSANPAPVTARGPESIILPVANRCPHRAVCAFALFLERIRAGAAVEAPTFGDVAEDLVATKGVVTLVGVVPFVLNFNTHVHAHDPREAVANVTAAVRDAQVEALTPPRTWAGRARWRA